MKNKLLLLNLLTKDNFAERLKQENVGSKNDPAEFIKKTDLDEKLKRKLIS